MYTDEQLDAMSIEALVAENVRLGNLRAEIRQQQVQVKAVLDRKLAEQARDGAPARAAGVVSANGVGRVGG